MSLETIAGELLGDGLPQRPETKADPSVTEEIGGEASACPLDGVVEERGWCRYPGGPQVEQRITMGVRRQGLGIGAGKTGHRSCLSPSLRPSRGDQQLESGSRGCSTHPGIGGELSLRRKCRPREDPADSDRLLKYGSQAAG